MALADLTAIFISLAVLAIAAVQALRLARRSR